MGARSTVMESPLGPLHVAAVDAGLCAVSYDGQAEVPCGVAALPAEAAAERILAETARRLADYFAGDVRALDGLPVRLHGTPFEVRVWLALRSIRPGTTLSYADLALRVGTRRGGRAVGAAIAHNRLPLVLPCHRVVGAGGALVGYRGGVKRTAWLLHHEGALLV